jgi:hypothetical protein
VKVMDGIKDKFMGSMDRLSLLLLITFIGRRLSILQIIVVQRHKISLAR